MDGYGGKTLRKEKFYDESGKNRKKGQQAVEDHSMTIQKSWVMMKDRTDKELKELVAKVRCDIPEGAVCALETGVN